jgi:hypothetical protein
MPLTAHIDHIYVLWALVVLNHQLTLTSILLRQVIQTTNTATHLYTSHRPEPIKIHFTPTHHQHQTSSTMKLTFATPLLFATLALASLAPVAQPIAIAKPVVVETRAQLHNALLSRDAAPAQLAARKSKPKGGSGNNTGESAASDMITPSRVLQLGALSLGVVVLWG